MTIVYIASSKTLSEWGASVGITKHLYKVGLGQGNAKDAVAALNDERCAGAADWKPVAAAETDESDEAAVLARLARTAKPVDPRYYPRLRNAPGIFRISAEAAENHFLVQKALAGEETRDFKLRPADIGTYILHAIGPSG